MNPLETELREALRGVGLPRAESARTLALRICEEYTRKRRAAGRLLAWYLLGLMIALMLMFWWLLEVRDVRQGLLVAVLILIAFGTTVLVKLWYWILHGRIAVVREIKLLQLMVAERLPRDPGAPAPVEDEGSPAEGEPARARAPWRGPLVAALWLCALAGSILLLWPRAGGIPAGAELYYERTVQPGEHAAIDDTFEVARSKARFQPVILPERGPVEARIAVGPSGGPTWYQGPVTESSRFWFGRDLPVGAYSIRIEPHRASASYRLRLYGVEEPDAALDPGTRTFLLMLLVAVVAAVPLAWIQARFLRHIDPELIG